MTSLMDTPARSLAAELRRQLDTKRDLVADTRRVTLADDGAMLVDMPEGVEEYGGIPCRSEYGDVTVGNRHTARTFALTRRLAQ